MCVCGGGDGTPARSIISFAIIMLVSPTSQSVVKLTLCHKATLVVYVTACTNIPATSGRFTSGDLWKLNIRDPDLTHIAPSNPMILFDCNKINTVLHFTPVKPFHITLTSEGYLTVVPSRRETVGDTWLEPVQRPLWQTLLPAALFPVCGLCT